jgi:hypothetical protein
MLGCTVNAHELVMNLTEQDSLFAMLSAPQKRRLVLQAFFETNNLLCKGIATDLDRGVADRAVYMFVDSIERFDATQHADFMLTFEFYREQLCI